MSRLGKCSFIRDAEGPSEDLDMRDTKRIGIIGAGAIGGAIIRELQKTADCEIAFVLVSSLEDAASAGLGNGILTDDANDALARPVDLVIEAALPSVVRDLAPKFLEKADFCAFSSTAMANRETEQEIRSLTARHGHTFYVPHGAVLALDGIADGRAVIEKVTVTTTKSGKSLGIDPDAEGLMFEGATRDACGQFPRNVNVHAAIALAGLGFDRTISRIIATPGLQTMEHRIEVEGQGLSWDLRVSSRSLGGVTGAYTPHSAVGSIRRILGGGGIAAV